VTSGRQKTIGLILDWLDPAYPLLILRGAQDAARTGGVNLICFSTGLPGPHGRQEWPAYEVMGPESIDGLIVLGNGPALDGEPAEGKLPECLNALPRAFVAGDQADASCVNIDNDAAMALPVDHLVRVHGHQRIGYIGGPDVRPDAQRRLRAIRAALAEHGLELDPRLALPGDFTVPAGRRAVKTLLDERQVSIEEVDAVVAANDGMAWGFIEELWTRGIRVPWDVAVTGFDDVAMARQARVALTTVRQPVRELGRVGAELLLAQLKGSAPKRVDVETHLVTRRSCGCLEGIGRLPLTPADLQQRGGRGFDVAFLKRQDALIAEMRQVGRGRLDALEPGWEHRLVKKAVDEIKGRSPDAFRLALDEALGRVVAADGDVTAFNDVATALWRHLIPCVLADQGLRTAVEGVLDGVRLAIASAALRAQVADQTANEIRAYQVVDVCSAISASETAEALAAVVEKRLPDLGISRLALAFFRSSGVGETMRCVLSLQNGTARLEQVDIPAKEFPARLISPSERMDLVVSGLGTSPRPFGLVCMDMEPLSQLVHDGVRDALGRACRRLRRDPWPCGR